MEMAYATNYMAYWFVMVYLVRHEILKMRRAAQ